MIRLVFIFVVLLLSVYIGLQLSHDPGYVLLTFNHWSLETTFWFAVFALVICFFILHLLLLLLKKLFRSPRSFHSWRTKRRVQKAQAKTQQGLIEFSEGYWSEAKDHLIKALPDTDSPLFNYLTAARAAQELGDNQLRDSYLREAQQSMPNAKIAVKLTQAQLQLANQQWEQALATLRHLQELAPRHPYVLKSLMRLYSEVKDWPQLIALLPELKKYDLIEKNVYDQLELQAYYQALCDLTKYSQTQALDQFIKHLPRHLNHNPLLMNEYCRFLVSQQELEKAENLLRHSLKKEFNESLIRLYGQINANDKQLAFAESLLKKQAHSAELFLCLGRLSFYQHLWGKAKSYFEKSIHKAPSAEAYEELGKLLERLSDQLGACTAYRQGLDLANKPLKAKLQQN